MKVRQFADGCEVDQALLVRDVAADFRREERTFKRLTLADRTGSVTAILPADLPGADDLAQAGAVVRVRGRYVVDSALRRPGHGRGDRGRASRRL